MKATGVGRFVRDPELKEIGDTCVCEFSLAVNESRKVNGERKSYAHFFDFVIWDKAAQLICEYKKKGDFLFFVATPRQDKWTDKEGNARQKVIFRVEDFTFLPRGARREDVEDDAQVETASPF